MKALAYDLGYEVINHINGGPRLIVAKSHLSPRHVNLIIDQRVCTVELRDLVNALSHAVKDASNFGVHIVTPEVRT